jgi:hypothetical protein
LFSSVRSHNLALIQPAASIIHVDGGDFGGNSDLLRRCGRGSFRKVRNPPASDA